MPGWLDIPFLGHCLRSGLIVHSPPDDLHHHCQLSTAPGLCRDSSPHYLERPKELHTVTRQLPVRIYRQVSPDHLWDFTKILLQPLLWVTWFSVDSSLTTRISARSAYNPMDIFYRMKANPGCWQDLNTFQRIENLASCTCPCPLQRQGTGGGSKYRAWGREGDWWQMTPQNSEVYGSMINIIDPEPSQHHQSLSYLDKKEEPGESQVQELDLTSGIQELPLGNRGSHQGDLHNPFQEK